jgi:hypothetical protein
MVGRLGGLPGLFAKLLLAQKECYARSFVLFFKTKLAGVFNDINRFGFDEPLDIG